MPLIINPENTLFFSRNRPELDQTASVELKKCAAHFAAEFKIPKNGATYNTAFL